MYCYKIYQIQENLLSFLVQKKQSYVLLHKLPKLPNYKSFLSLKEPIVCNVDD
jgi:hypothetical protein